MLTISRFATLCYAVGIFSACSCIGFALHALSYSGNRVAAAFFCAMSIVSYFIGRSSWYALVQHSQRD
jgi:hypothetical protein